MFPASRFVIVTCDASIVPVVIQPPLIVVVPFARLVTVTSPFRSSFAASITTPSALRLIAAIIPFLLTFALISDPCAVIVACCVTVTLFMFARMTIAVLMTKPPYTVIFKEISELSGIASVSCPVSTLQTIVPGIACVTVTPEMLFSTSTLNCPSASVALGATAVSAVRPLYVLTVQA